MSTSSRICHTTERVASRRTVVRGVAWSAAAVTVVVATPNVAAASGATYTVSTASTGIYKWSDKSVKHVTWTLTITNTGSVAIPNLTGSFTYADSSGSPATDLSLTSTSSLGGQARTWGSSSTLVKIYPVELAAGETLTLTGVYTSANNAGGSVSASFSGGQPPQNLGTVTARF